MNIKNIYYSLKENIIIVIWFVIVFLGYKKALDFLGETYSDIIGVLFICLIIFLFIGKIGEKIKNIIKQKRLDLIFNYLVLIGFFVYFELLEYKFESFKYVIKYFEILYNYGVNYINHRFVFGIIFFYIFIFPIIYICKKIKNTKKESEEEKSFFISDKPIEAQKKDNIYKWCFKKETKEEEIKDELGFDDKAKSFSQLIYENGSDNNQVFGLVAEWGSGKSSFINLVKSESIIKDNCLVIEFAPWFYETEKELLKKFLETITSTIKENGFYAPTLSNSFDDLVKLFDKNSEKILGFNIPFFEEKTLETIKTNIDDSLKAINKKTIIIIDDLDRVSSVKLKEMFKIINLCKDFYKTNFIVCYDPQNFNSIDENLVKNITQNDGEITSITTQKIDNSELTKYMSKIINVYFPLNIEAEKIKEYFEEIFTDKKYLNFSDASIEGIKSGINKLFEPENYYLWGKYYSNIRGIKRILNNIIAVFNQIEKKESKIKNLFHINFGLKFDIFIKFSILSIYFNYIYTDIKKEVDLTDILGEEYYMKSFKYKLPNNIGILNQINGDTIKKRSVEYNNYLKELSPEETELLKDLINLDNKNLIRNGNEIDNYIKVIENNYEEIEENVFLADCYNNFLNDKPVKEILKEIKEKYDFERINKFIRNFLKPNLVKITDELKKDKAIEFIDGMIDFDDFYNLSNSRDFYIYIPRVLESSVPYENTDENIKYIGEYFYGEGIYKNKGPIYKRILEKGINIGTDISKIKSISEVVVLIFSLDQSRGANNYNFYKSVGNIQKLANLIFEEIKNNFFSENILMKVNNLKPEYIGKNFDNYHLSTILFYPIIKYASEDKKQEISDYLIKCFNEDINLFIEFVCRFIKEYDFQNKKDKYFFSKNEFLEYFMKDNILKFINDNKKFFNKLENKKHIIPNSFTGRKNIEVDIKWILDEIFKIEEKITN